jgi:hypothetical protein
MQGAFAFLTRFCLLFSTCFFFFFIVNVLILSLLSAIKPLKMLYIPTAEDQFGRPTKEYQSTDLWSGHWEFLVPLM